MVDDPLRALFQHSSRQTYWPLRERVFAALKESILSGVLPTGTPLIETKIAKRLGVSRTPVREAARRLETERLISRAETGSLVVAGPTEKDIEDTYLVLAYMEGLAARLAATNATDEDIAELGKMVDLMGFFSHRGDIDALIEHNPRFHRKIHEIGRNDCLMTVLANLFEYVRDIRHRPLYVPGRLGASMDEHRAVYHAIADREPLRAESVAFEHILESSRHLKLTSVIALARPAKASR